MKLIVGLGNIGAQYAGTRHNIGFMIADKLAAQLDQSAGFKKHNKAAAQVTDLKATHGCIIAKPTTMMNLSGQAVNSLMNFYKIDPADVLVVYDDVDIEFGTLRIRFGGSSAGHNGIKSIAQHCGGEFWRFRLGVRNEHFAETATDRFVLDDFNTTEAKNLPQIITKTASLLATILSSDQPTDTSVNFL